MLLIDSGAEIIASTTEQQEALSVPTQLPSLTYKKSPYSKGRPLTPPV